MPEYSISQIGKFEECALQYKFIYVDKIKRYEEGVVPRRQLNYHETRNPQLKKSARESETA